MIPSYYNESREIICKYLRDFSPNILPSHSSYKILFFEDGIQLEGKCCRGHTDRIELMDFNRDSTLIHKKIKEDQDEFEFLPIIPTDKCTSCITEVEENEQKMQEMQNFDEDTGNTISEITLKFQEFDNPFDMREIVNQYPSETLKYALTESGIKKIIEIIEQIDVDILIMAGFFTPALVSNSEINQKIIEKLNKLDPQEKTSTLMFLFIEILDFNLFTEKEDHLKILLDGNLKEIFKEFLQDLEENQKLDFLLRLITFLTQDYQDYSGLKSYYLKNEDLYKYFKIQFINLIFKVIENPQANENVLELLIDRKEILNVFHDYRLHSPITSIIS